MWLLRFVWRWLQLCGGLVALAALGWLVAARFFHLSLLNVQTGSMRPTFAPGDALIMRRLPQGSIRPGMVVSYHSARNPNELVTHRVVAASSGMFQTKGDALTVPDPPVRGGLLAGRVITVLPRMGHVLSWVQSVPGLIILVYLPAAAITIQELIRLERNYKRLRIYRLEQVV